VIRAPAGARSIVAFGAAVVLVFAGCASTPPSSPAPSAAVPSVRSSEVAPSSSPDAVEAWLPADVAQPSAVTSAPSLAPGYQCHPCHFLAENQLFGVGAIGSATIAVGVQQPPAQAVVFSSTDGTKWSSLAGFSGADGTTATAVATNGASSVIVGRSADGATAWSLRDGRWTEAPPQPDLRIPYAAGAMTSVTAFGDGFVAGGYHDDPLHAAASAAVWRSTDGLTWHTDRSGDAFANGRILGVAAHGDTIVAVGTAGDPNYGPAGVWRWTASSGWQKARISGGGAGAMRAVASTGSGFVAVGLNGHDDGAAAWTSPDGMTWTPAPDQPAFHFFTSPVRMQSIASGPSGLVAGGWRSDAGKGSAVVWTSSDGVTWHGPTWQQSFSGAQITAVTFAGGAVVAVGRNGYPDWNQAAIWRATRP
jgi:hypothetical protein